LVVVAESTGKSEFRDDVFVTPEGVFHWSDFNPYGLRAQIEASKVPMMVGSGQPLLYELRIVEGTRCFILFPSL
jgi:hypothetical protein